MQCRETFPEYPYMIVDKKEYICFAFHYWTMITFTLFIFNLLKTGGYVISATLFANLYDNYISIESQHH